MPKINKVPRTKLEAILIKKGWTQKDFIKRYNKVHPASPMLPYHLCGIVSGKKKRLNLETVYRICYVLDKTPNQILDYEDILKKH